MKLAVAVAFLSLLQNSPAATPQQPAAKGVLEGIVVRAGTGEPIAGAQVILTSSLFRPDGFNGPSPIPPGTTGSDGRFSFKDMDAATYRIAVAASGYVRQEYGQQSLAGTGKSVYLAAGQTLKDLNIALTPAATVTGRILDDAGQPAPETLVQLVTETWGPQGRNFRGAGMANADDRGEFRMFGVTPGRYYLVAGSVQVLQVPEPGAGDVISIRTSRTVYAPTFYPGVPDTSAATMVDLKSGSEFRANLTVKRPVDYRVSGRVIDSASADVPSNVRIILGPKFSPTGRVQPMLQGRNTSVVTSTGTFEFPNVPPGEWTVRAEIPLPVQPATGPLDPAASAARNAAQASRPYGQVSVHITNANVEGLVVALSRGFSVPARISVEGGPLSTMPNADRISLRFQSSENGALSQATTGVTPSASRPGPDGTLQIDGVRPGEFLMSVLGTAPGFYLKSARYGSEDVLHAPIRFSSSASGVVELTFRAGAGQVSGTVTDSKSQPVPGIQTILIPEQSLRNRQELYRTTVTDQNGRFTLSNIPPGNYKLFSWEALQQSGYFNSDVMKQFEAQGRAIRVVESSNETVEVKMISAAQ